MTALFVLCVVAVLGLLAYGLIRLRSKGRQALRRDRREQDAQRDPAVVEPRGDSGPPTEGDS